MAIILVHRTPNQIGKLESITYEWRVVPWDDDPKSAYVPRHLLEETFRTTRFKVGQVFVLGDLRLRVVDEFDVLRCSYRVQRDGLPARIASLVAPFRRLLDLIYRRLIITLAVWHLAQFHEARLPSWRDVYLLNRIARSWTHSHN